MRVLLCGESWVTHSLHIKGVDSFTTSSYVEGADHLRAALEQGGVEVDYLPGHLVPARFPASAADQPPPLASNRTSGGGATAAAGTR